MIRLLHICSFISLIDITTLLQTWHSRYFHLACAEQILNPAPLTRYLRTQVPQVRFMSNHLTKPDSQGILPEQTSTVLALLEPMKKYRLVGLNSKWNQMVGLGLAQKIRGTAAAGRVAKNGGSDWGGMRVRVIDVSREDKLKQQGSRFGDQPPNYPDDYKFSKIAGYA